jgi:hypothetical protein
MNKEWQTIKMDERHIVGNQFKYWFLIDKDTRKEILVPILNYEFRYDLLSMKKDDLETVCSYAMEHLNERIKYQKEKAEEKINLNSDRILRIMFQKDDPKFTINEDKKKLYVSYSVAFEAVDLDNPEV